MCYQSFTLGIFWSMILWLHLKIINHMYETDSAMQSHSNWSITTMWRADWMLYGNKMEQQANDLTKEIQTFSIK